MAITDNGGYVKQAVAGFLGLLMTQGAASAESKFLISHGIRSLDGQKTILIKELCTL